MPGQPIDPLDIRDFGASCDGTADDTASITGALTYMQQTYGSGAVVIPSGVKTVIGGQVTVPSSCGIISDVPGPHDPSSPSGLPIILVPNATVSPIVLGTRDSYLHDVVFYYPNQIPPTSLANPTVYPPTITTPTGSAGHKVRRVTLANAYDGFQLYGGRHVVESCWVGALHNPFVVDHSLDRIRIQHIQCNPFWNTIAGLPYPQNIDTWVAANKTVLTVMRADALFLEDIFAFVGNTFMQLLDGTDTPAPSYGDGVSLRADTFTTGLSAKATQGPGWQIVNFSANVTGNNVQAVAGGSATPKVRIEGGSFWGPSTAVLASGGNFSISNVENYNPKGGGASQMTFTASGQTKANANPFPSVAFVSTGAGLTVSAVAIGGTTVTNLAIAASSTVPVGVLAPNQGLTLTYSGTGNPTVQLFGL